KGDGSVKEAETEEWRGWDVNKRLEHALVMVQWPAWMRRIGYNRQTAGRTTLRDRLQNETP
ncbi:MAG: hypothetical protein ACRCZ5_12950, partial [Burkholderiales bacterium]